MAEKDIKMWYESYDFNVDRDRNIGYNPDCEMVKEFKQHNNKVNSLHKAFRYLYLFIYFIV